VVRLRRGRLWLAAAVACVAVPALAAAPAQATIDPALHLPANCAPPGPGIPALRCNDGVPAFGGTTQNATGANAITVPAKYGGDGYTGLPDEAPDATTVPGSAQAGPEAGTVALDVDVTLPTAAPPPGGFPMVVLMHGCCAGDKTSWQANSFDAGGERWHYSDAWFAARGYVVITYTARGFVNSQNRGSTGQTELDSRSFEINDYQHLACQVMGASNGAGQAFDDVTPVEIDPDRVVTTGGSYGGGFSWMALTDPKWTCSADTGAGGATPSLVASAPKYGWTDLVYSLVPTGQHSPRPGDLPATNGCDSGPAQPDGSPCPDPANPVGIPKQSINAALYASGKTGVPPLTSSHTTFPPKIDEGILCLEGPYPADLNPACSNTIQNLLPEFLRERSAYYQQQFFDNIASDPSYRVPVFSAGTFTDPLFTAVEHRRMLNRLRSIVPDYPIQTYHGDYNHFVQNKAKEWGDLCGADHHVCSAAGYPNGGAGPSDYNADPAGLFRTGPTTRLNRFVDHYADPVANPTEPQPAFDATASLQVCPQNAADLGVAADEGGPQFNAATFEQLAPNVLDVDMPGGATTTSDAEPNPHALSSDPLANQVSNGARCPVENGPAGPGVASYLSDPLPFDQTMLGSTQVEIDFAFTGADPVQSGFQLNARLYDVYPNGTAVMVDRGVQRVTESSGTLRYELHGNGWRFESGHRIRIEIAQDDQPFLQVAAPPSSASLSAVRLHVPVREGGSVGGGPETEGSQAPAGPCANEAKGTKKNDKLVGTPDGDRIKGAKGNDRVSGEDGDDCLKGNRGDDRVSGGGGDDQASGGPGSDRLGGGTGNDRLKARGGGRDVVKCGPGEDTAKVDKRDRVRGCEKVRRGGSGGK
jgi:dienelactone hydrolase